MDRRVTALEARLEELGRELELVRRRLEALERSGAPSPTASSAPAPHETSTAPSPRAPSPPVTGADAETPARWIALAGRSLIVLGGAYLLRALVEAEVLALGAGVALGLAYAGVWLLAALRSERLGGSFHGVTATLVAYPLLWETTAHLHALGPWTAAALVAAFAAAALAAAARRDLPVVAAAATAPAAVLAVALALATRHAPAYAVLALALLAMTAWFGARGRWTGLLWVPALAADLLVLQATLVAMRTDVADLRTAPVPVAFAVAAAVALLALSLATTAVRTLARREAVDGFDLIQTMLALLIGAGGAARVLTAHGAASAPVGLLLLLVGAGATLGAFSVLRLRPSSRGTTFFYATCGAALGVAGSSMLLRGAPLALLLAAAAVAATVVARGAVRRVLVSYAAVLLAAAGVVSGLLPGTADRLLGAPGWPPFPAVAFAVAAAVGACFVHLALHPPPPGLRWFALLPRIAVGAMAVWTGGGLAVALVVGGLGAPLAAAGLATLRTAVVVTAALGCAAVVRAGGPRELAWFVAPILAAGGLKLLLEDLQHGRALTLFLSLGLYGLALTVAPRLLRRSDRPSPAQEALPAPGPEPREAPGR